MSLRFSRLRGLRHLPILYFPDLTCLIVPTSSSHMCSKHLIWTCSACQRTSSASSSSSSRVMSLTLAGPLVATCTTEGCVDLDLSGCKCATVSSVDTWDLIIARYDATDSSSAALSPPLNLLDSALLLVFPKPPHLDSYFLMNMHGVSI